jgi:ubiquinone/menaquinone biosynthesis C-methylase UbiE
MHPNDQIESEKVAFERHYDIEATSYDQHRYACLCKRMISELQQEFVIRMLHDAERVLDAGCGTGRFTIPLARQGIQVVALDASKEMLTVARRKAEQAKVIHRIEFVLGDVENLDFANGGFDGAISIAVLRHFPSPAQGIAELTRVVRPGGTLIVDYLNWHMFRFYEPLRGLFIQDPNVPDQHFFRNYYSTFSEIRDLMARNGAQVVQRKGVSKLPSHLLLCQLHLGFLAGLLHSLEHNINFGAVVMVAGRKQSGSV